MRTRPLAINSLRLSPEAVEELAEAAAWYTQRPGLEMEFLTEVRRVVPLIDMITEEFPRRREPGIGGR
jgi:hypothetical protein